MIRLYISIHYLSLSMSNVEHCSCMWICCPHGSL